MGYTIKFGDITEFESDLIVNSLGTNGSVYGMLCEAILRAADSKELTNYIDSLKNCNIGDIYVTEPGKLSCKKILHIVTPFKYMDDDKNTLLEKAYNDLLKKAVELGYKTIVLPFIGSGANGYSEYEVSEVVTKVCGALALKEHEEKRPILDIIIVCYVKPRRRRREREERYSLERECYESFVDREVLCKCMPTDGGMPEINKPKRILSTDERNLIKNTLLIQKVYSYIDPDDMLLCKVKTRPYSFVMSQIAEMGIDDKEFIIQGVPSDVKSRWSKRTEIEKINIYRIAFISKMNLTRLLQFMMINNKHFNPEDELDIFMVKYFEGKSFYTCYNLAQFSILCYKECGVDLKFNRNKGIL